MSHKKWVIKMSHWNLRITNLAMQILHNTDYFFVVFDNIFSQWDQIIFIFLMFCCFGLPLLPLFLLKRTIFGHFQWIENKNSGQKWPKTHHKHQDVILKSSNILGNDTLVEVDFQFLVWFLSILPISYLFQHVDCLHSLVFEIFHCHLNKTLLKWVIVN